MPKVRSGTSREGVRTLCIDREEKRNAPDRATVEELEAIVLVPLTDAAKEGIDAFFAKRRPVWTGR